MANGYFIRGRGGSGSGGGEASEQVEWHDVNGKPEKFPPEEHSHDERYSRVDHNHDEDYSPINHNHDGQYSEVGHNHDDRYNTKEQVASEIDFVRQQMVAGQGRVAISSEDEPDYLSSKVDNTTVTVEGMELVVKSMDGLTVGATDISAWLAGTSDNVQTQINNINDSLVAVTSGMHYKGIAETRAELDGWGVKIGGDLVVVVEDETKEGARSMYVYNEDHAKWDFIGAFTFSDSFTALKDTPDTLEGQDGKALRVRGERVVLEDVSYDDLSNKPTSSITQIDDAVDKKHEHLNKELLDEYNQTNGAIVDSINKSHTHGNKELLDAYTQTETNLEKAVSQSHVHSNKSDIDRIGINEDGLITIDGVPYTPHVKGYLYARASSGSIAVNGTWRWIRASGRGITLRDNGVFVLEEGKTYQITVSASIISLSDWKRFGLIDTETRSIPPEAPNDGLVMAVNSNRGEGHSGVLSLIITPTSTRNFGITFTGGYNATTATLNPRTSLVITEL